MKSNNRTFFWVNIVLLMLFAASAKAVDNLNFHGTLVQVPCSVAPGSENIALDIGDVIDKYLYANTRTQSKPFTIRLENCDTALSNTVDVEFDGTESLALAGLIALEPGSGATGIAIGIESPEGVALPLNTVKTFTLNNGSTDLVFYTYVQAEPQAISSKNIGRGTFSSVANFTLAYP